MRHRAVASRTAAGGTATYADEVLADSPVSFWLLDESSGTNADDQGSAAVDSTYTGSYTLAGKTIGSLTGVDLTGGYVNANADNAGHSAAGASGVLSVECCFKLDTLASKKLVAKGDGGGYEWELRVTSAGAVQFVSFIASGGAEVLMASSATGLVTTGVGYHIVGTYDRAAPRQEVWLNGTAVGNDTTPTGTNEMSNGVFQVQIGRRRDGGDGVIDGGIAGVAIYGSVLSSGRIAAHYAASGV